MFRRRELLSESDVAGVRGAGHRWIWLRQRLPGAAAEDRHGALALTSQFGHTSVVRLMLDGGKEANRYNPAGCYSHSNPLHQGALGGHEETIRLLMERGAHLNAKDTLWQGTPAD